MNEDLIMEFLSILAAWNLDLDDIGLDLEDIEDLDADELNTILEQVEPDLDDDDEEDDEEEEEY